MAIKSKTTTVGRTAPTKTDNDINHVSNECKVHHNYSIDTLTPLTKTTKQRAGSHYNLRKEGQPNELIY